MWGLGHMCPCFVGETLKDWIALQVAGSPVPFYEKSMGPGRSLMEFGEREGVSSGDLSAQYAILSLL